MAITRCTATHPENGERCEAYATKNHLAKGEHFLTRQGENRDRYVAFRS